MADISSVEHSSPKQPAPPVEAPRAEAPEADPDRQPMSPARKPREAEAAVTVVQRRSKLRLKLENFEFEIEDGDIVGRSFVGKEVLHQFPGISRKHAQFIWDDGKWFVEDLESTNGTYINGNPLKGKQRLSLKLGDKVGISKKVTFEVISV